MSSRIPDTHAEAWALLPFLANGRIQASDREWVEAHVAGCEECRAEVAAQRMMATAMNRDATPGNGATDEQRSFNRLWARIEASESASPASVAASEARPTMRSSRTVRWLAAAVVIQGFGLALFGFNALREPSEDIRHGDGRRSGFAPQCAHGAHRIRTGRIDRDHQHAARAPGFEHRLRARDRGQFHRGAVGRCGSLGRFGEFRRRRDCEGSQCHFRAAGCTLT